MSDLYHKYIVSKSDGSPVDPDAQYFLLRIDTDPAAQIALLVYADRIEAEDTALAVQLRAWVSSARGGREVTPKN